MTSRVGKNGLSATASRCSDFSENLTDATASLCAKMAQFRQRKRKKEAPKPSRADEEFHNHRPRGNGFVGSISSGCRRRTNSEEEAPDTSSYHPEATPATQFERDLKYVRDAHFAYVWVFSRKDGKEFTKEDSQALRTNAPGVVDWVTTDSNRKVIGGSNFAINPPQMAALEKRFKIEDYSGK